MQDEGQQDAPEGLAIIGMAGRFPGARDLDELWQNLSRGVESISWLSRPELEAAGFEPSHLNAPGFVPAGGVVAGSDLFDAAFFGFSAQQAEITDPQHRLFLEQAWSALENAGYDAASFEGAIGAFGGMSMSSYLLYHLLPNPRVLATAGDLQIRIHNDKDFLASRVAYKLGLTGPALSVQTACSTSLVAVCLACQSLMAYQCDMALAGGVAITCPTRCGYFAHEEVFSPDGHCRPFDAAASGTVSGDGVGLVVLKRLADALADGDTIRAVIRGFAVNNDGGLKVGYTAPSVEGQLEVIAMAQAMAGVEPAEISYVEAHGTGTPLGDPIEVEALNRAFVDAEGSPLPAGSCALGSIKSNIGHLDAAAGAASLIKTVLALEHRQLPPSLHFAQPNPRIDFAAGPFYVNTELHTWQGPEPLKAGVSAFAVGGVNAHVVVQEAPPPAPSGPARGWQLLVLSAATPTALDSATGNLARHLEAHPDLSLADVAYTLQLGRKALRYRRALVCRDRADAIALLRGEQPRRLLAGERETRRRPVAFLFSGLGLQYPGMAAELYAQEPVFRQELDRCCDLLASHLGTDLRTLIYPAGGEARSSAAAASTGPDLRAMVRAPEAASSEPLAHTRHAQPALFALDYALARLWQSWGVEPQAMVGYSIGEYVAACLAGVLELEHAARLVAQRALLADRLPAGAMLAVPMAEQELAELLGAGLAIAASNGPESCVVAGPEEAVAGLEATLAERGVTSRRLATRHAFHSPMMAPAQAELAALAASLPLKPPRIPYLSNLTGTWITPEQATDPAYYGQHLVQPVRFGAALEELWKEPGRVLLEVGPGQALSAWALQHPAGDTVPDRVVLASLPHAWDAQPDLAFALQTLGRLWLAGLPVDWRRLYAGQQRRRVPLPTYPFEGRRYWIEPRPLHRPAGEAEVAAEAAPEGAAPPSATGAESHASAPDGRARHPRPNLPVPFVAPRNGLEEELAAMWREMLGLEEVGVDDNFFDIGGDSLQATRLLARLEESHGVALPLKQLFEAATVSQLAVVLVQQQAAQADPQELLAALAEVKGVSLEELQALLAQETKPE